jgi:hypothetical protein
MLLGPDTEFFARYTIIGDDPLSVEAYSTRSSLITYFPKSSRPIATGKLTPSIIWFADNDFFLAN